MGRLVIDSSVSLKWWLDDEDYVDEARKILLQIHAGRIIPVVPDLWYYEVVNGIRTAVFRKRITKKQGRTFIIEMLSLGFETMSIVFYLPKIFDYAIKYKYAIYDLSYLVLAEEQKIQCVTGDTKFFNTVKDDLSFVYHLSAFPAK
jgi:predicted nucleic acid-binding protein